MASIDLMLVSKMLFLLATANGVPVFMKKILGEALAYPIDGGMTLSDGRPLLGKSKTVRGVVSSILATSLCAPLIGWTVGAGAVVGAAAMGGDMLSSFLKRRMKIPPSGMATGLYQIPEALLPALAARGIVPLSYCDILLVVCGFFIGALIVSRAFYILRFRDQPY